MAPSGLIRAHPDFRRMWIGDGLSKLGGAVAVLAVPVLAAATLDATTWQVALLTTYASLPFLLIGLPVGAWSDRMRRRPVLVAADLGRAAAMSWVPIAAALDILTIEQLYAVVLLLGIGNVFFDVSQGAYLPVLVGPTRLVEGNSRLEANRAVAFSAGPSIGGQLVQWLGAPLALLGTTIGFLWSAAWLASIRTVESPPPRRPDQNLLREIREGLRFVLGQPFIRATTFHATAAVLFLSARYAIETLFLLRTIGLRAGGIGLLMTITGLGAVAGAVLANRLSRRLGHVRTVLVASLGMGLAGLLIPLTRPGPGLALFAAGSGVVAFWITANNVAVVSLRQVLCPGQLLGRMNATTRFLAWASLPLGGVLGGALGTALGLRTALWVSAAGLLLSALWIVASPSCRVRDLPAAAAAGGGPAGSADRVRKAG
jgi:predicted MFS family arabinose efflux permease